MKSDVEEFTDLAQKMEKRVKDGRKAAERTDAELKGLEKDFRAEKLKSLREAVDALLIVM